MNIKIIKVGYLETNCYILEKENKSLIIDPGDEASKIMDSIKGEVVGVLITHHHPDHTGALIEILKKYNTKVYDINNLQKGTNIIDDFKFEVIYNPGHTDDSISFLFDNLLFSGDFIFEGTIGRTDLRTGNMSKMQESIRNILSYPEDLIIYPGHGETTTLKKEVNNLKYYLD